MAIKLVIMHHVAKVCWQHVVLLRVNGEHQKHLNVVMGEESRVEFIVIDVDKNFLRFVWLYISGRNDQRDGSNIPVRLQAL